MMAEVCGEQGNGSINYLIDNESWKIEREADGFASKLLMPENSIKAFVSGREFDFQVLQDIAGVFQVSLSAAALRFVEIGNHPIMVVYGVDKMIRWVRKSEDFPFWRLRYGNGKGDQVPNNTVMGTYFYENDDSDCKSEETVYAEDWFDTRREDDNDREFVEWCIGYQNKAFSVIWEK